MTKKITAMGGGNAMPKVVLVGLKDLDVELSVICAMLDTGGSSGRLRKDYKILAPGDIRRAFLALANTSPVIENFFNYRFEMGELKGHNMANLFIAALELSTHNYEDTIEVLNKILDVKHRVFPITLEKSEVCAVLENGQTISGETNIDKPKHKEFSKIKKIYLNPPVQAYKKSLEAIKEADLIIIGPGDLYSTLAQILLCKGVKEAIKERKGKTVYVVNLMTKDGETNGFSVADFSREIEKFIDNELDYVVYNTNIPPSDYVLRFKEKHPELLEMARIDDKLSENKFVGSDLLAGNGDIVHSPTKLAKILMNL
ncbi:MAG: YvcK family protein [Candidatus Parcubacteria bacterium]|nr:YvcK family protein [Candidatus Parcubacteria bacterium]